MISVSDYPFSEIANNNWTYGNYCIGFNRSWGEKVGLSPVCYCSYGSRSLKQLSELLKEAIDINSNKLFGLAMYMFAHMKFVQAPLKTKQQLFETYRFYDEREWRVVPYITETDQAEVMPFLTEDAYKEYKKSHNGKSLLNIGVDFQYDDIHYIIVETEQDIQKTRDIVGDRVHIFTKEEVMTDMIGIAHHEEILPSKEQIDHEGAQRQMERIREMFDEAWANRKKN